MDPTPEKRQELLEYRLFRAVDALIAKSEGYTNIKHHPGYFRWMPGSWTGIPPEPCPDGTSIPHYTTEEETAQELVARHGIQATTPLEGVIKYIENLAQKEVK